MGTYIGNHLSKQGKLSKRRLGHPHTTWWVKLISTGGLSWKELGAAVQDFLFYFFMHNEDALGDLT